MPQQLNFLWKNHQQVKYQRLLAETLILVYDCSGKNLSKENDYGGFSAILQIAEVTKNDFLESLYTP